MKISTPFVDLLPPLQDAEFEALKADIEANGVHDPIWEDEEGNILDGRHRLKIKPDAPRRVAKGLTAAEKEAFVFRTNFVRRNLSPAQKEEVDRARKATAKKLASEGKTQAEIGKLLGVSRECVSKWFTREPKSNGTSTSRIKHEPKPKSKAKLNKAAKKEVVRQVHKGKSQAQVGANFGIDQATVSRIVQAERKEAEKKAEKAARAAEGAKLSIDGFRFGDFREIAKQIPDGTVDLIFTDPPYDRKTLPLYGDLAKIAASKLVDGGSLICYLGQFQIDKVINLLTPHLRLWWTLAVVHSGDSARMTEYGVVVKWKPLLWFVKNTRGDKHTFVDDAVFSTQEKSSHDWQQSVVEASYYIEKLTPVGGLVFDPFCGGGTTFAACKSLGRRCITCDIDEKTLNVAKARIA